MQVELTEPEVLAERSLRPSNPTVLAAGLFVALQCLDLLTTLAILARGGVELNPVVRSLMPWTGQLLALVVSKAIVLSAVLLLIRRRRLLRFANILYTALIAWNVVIFFLLGK